MISQGFTVPDRPKKVFELMPEGVYNVELIDVTDEEKSVYQKPDEKEIKLVFTFAVIDEGPHYGRRVWDEAKPTITVKPKASNLHIILQKLTGVSFTEEQCNNQKDVLTTDFLNSLIGIQKQLSIVIHTSKTGNQSNQIDAYLPTKVSMPPFDETKVAKEE